MLDFLDSNGRLSSDKIPHARLSKTTRFADTVFQQDPQLAGIMSGMSSGITADAAPAQQHVFKLLLVPSRVSMLLILVGVVISLQVSVLLPSTFYLTTIWSDASCIKHLRMSWVEFGKMSTWPNVMLLEKRCCSKWMAWYVTNVRQFGHAGYGPTICSTLALYSSPSKDILLLLLCRLLSCLVL